MKPIFFFIILFIIIGCSIGSKAKNDMEKENQVKLTENSKVFDGAYDDVFYKNKFARGRDTLQYYLKNVKYDSSLFYAYHALTTANINLLNFQEADSVNKFINRSELDAQEDLEWLGDALELSLQFGKFDLAMLYSNERYGHAGNKEPVWLQKNSFLYRKWLIFSLMHKCDSAKGYLGAYIEALKKLDQVREWQNIDSTKMKYFENQLKSDCPLMDSVGLNLPTIVVYQ